MDSMKKGKKKLQEWLHAVIQKDVSWWLNRLSLGCLVNNWMAQMKIEVKQKGRGGIVCLYLAEGWKDRKVSEQKEAWAVYRDFTETNQVD